MAMTMDDVVMVLATQVMENAASEVRAAGELSWGMRQKYGALIPRKTVDELLDDTSPYVWMYAMGLQELLDAIEAAPKAAFVNKKAKNKDAK